MTLSFMIESLSIARWIHVGQTTIDAKSTLIQSHGVESRLIQCWFSAVCPLGQISRFVILYTERNN